MKKEITPFVRILISVILFLISATIGSYLFLKFGPNPIGIQIPCSNCPNTAIDCLCYSNTFTFLGKNYPQGASWITDNSIIVESIISLIIAPSIVVFLFNKLTRSKKSS